MRYAVGYDAVGYCALALSAARFIPAARCSREYRFPVHFVFAVYRTANKHRTNTGPNWQRTPLIIWRSDTRRRTACQTAARPARSGGQARKIVTEPPDKLTGIPKCVACINYSVTLPATDRLVTRQFDRPRQCSSTLCLCVPPPSVSLTATRCGPADPQIRIA